MRSLSIASVLWLPLAACVLALAASSCVGPTTAAGIGYRAAGNLLSRSTAVQPEKVRAVGDDRRQWRRTVTGPEGQPLSHGSAGWPVSVVWDIPLRTGSGVEAVAALGSVSCALPPHQEGHWSLLDEAGGDVGEAWHVTPHGRRAQEIDALAAESLAMAIDARAEYRVTWLLILPRPGRYSLRASWAAWDAQGLGAAPCIDAWAPLPLDLALAVANSPASPRSGAPGLPPPELSPFDALMTQQHSATSAAVDHPAGPTAVPGLLGIPAHDLLRLHEAALAREAGRPAAAEPDLLRQARFALLQQVRRTVGPEARAVCVAFHGHGLGEGGLALWNGEPTLPAVFLPDC